MLFDLKGRRRRVVQATYLSLAILMGAGLVLFGIGGEVSGGLVDGLSGDGSGDQGEVRKPLEKQVEDADRRVQANPKDQAALAQLVRAHFGLAGLEQIEQDGIVVGYNEKGQEQLRQAEQAWSRYLDTDPKRIDTGLAATAIQIYNVLGPPQETEKFVLPAREIAEQESSPEAYIRLFAVATRAGDARTAGLAERKALSLAESKDERNTIKERIETERVSASGDQGAGGNGAAPQGP